MLNGERERPAADARIGQLIDAAAIDRAIQQIESADRRGRVPALVRQVVSAGRRDCREPARRLPLQQRHQLLAWRPVPASGDGDKRKVIVVGERHKHFKDQ